HGRGGVLRPRLDHGGRTHRGARHAGGAEGEIRGAHHRRRLRAPGASGKRSVNRSVSKLGKVLRRPPSALSAFVRKELHHILRDRQTLAILLLMPLTQVLLFGYALRTDIRDLRVSVVDPTPDVVTMRLRSRLAATDRFHLVSVSPTTNVLEEQFQRR